MYTSKDRYNVGRPLLVMSRGYNSICRGDNLSYPCTRSFIGEAHFQELWLLVLGSLPPEISNRHSSPRIITAACFGKFDELLTFVTIHKAKSQIRCPQEVRWICKCELSNRQDHPGWSVFWEWKSTLPRNRRKTVKSFWCLDFVNMNRWQNFTQDVDGVFLELMTTLNPLTRSSFNKTSSRRARSRFVIFRSNPHWNKLSWSNSLLKNLYVSKFAWSVDGMKSGKAFLHAPVPHKFNLVPH